MTSGDVSRAHRRSVRPYLSAMTTRSAHSTEVRPVDPAIALADALQFGFAAQRSGCQRSRAGKLPVER